ncbi:hypothetical protein C8Q76DRAFT_790692 [Earliella scabrosa]|nr:hypothetical protein C8Q76DRAFT_790692 [Earliella scabrosa]
MERIATAGPPAAVLNAGHALVAQNVPGADPPRARSSGSPAEEEEEPLVKIYAGKLFDPDTLQLLPRRVVTVSQARGLVLDVQPYTDQELGGADFSGAHAVDLSEATVLPGFVDAHVHIRLHLLQCLYEIAADEAARIRRARYDEPSVRPSLTLLFRRAAR